MTKPKLFRKIIVLICIMFLGIFLMQPVIKVIENRIDNKIQIYERSYKHRYDSLILRIDSLENLINRTVPTKFSASIDLRRVSMYNATAHQTDNDSTKTASGRIINPATASGHRWVAVSQDLMTYNGGKLRTGDLIYLVDIHDQSGYYTVADVMPKSWTRSVDILETEGTTHYLYSNVKLLKI